MHGLHHYHLRKRTTQKLEPFPSRKFGIRTLDRVVFAVGLLSPVLTVPQIVEIFSTHQAAGVSPITWGAYTIFSVPWLMYGIAHREPALIWSNAVWIVINGAVFTGALIYGGFV